MKQRIRFRISGKRSQVLAMTLPAKQLPQLPGYYSIFEVELDFNDPRLRDIFKSNGEVGHYERAGWSVTFPQIWRTYEPEELEASPYIHVNSFRSFAEPMPNPDHYEFLPHCRCKVPDRQIAPIVLTSALKCKDALVLLSDGAWAAKPEFAAAILGSELDLVAFTPIFNSRRALSQWKPRTNPAGPRLGGLMEHFRLGREQFESYHWLQVHFPVGPLSIVPPTDGRHTPYVDDPPSVRCGCEEVYGGGLSSELYLRGERSRAGDWFLTRQFVGTSGGVYLPMRQLLVSQRALAFLKGFRLRNIEFDCVHVEE